MSHVFRLHGIPTCIVSDRGPTFTSQVFVQHWVSMSVFHLDITPNQEMETDLRCVTSSNPPNGVLRYPGWNIPTKPSPTPRKLCHPSSVLWVINPPCSPPKRSRWRFPQAVTICTIVIAPGGRPVALLCASARTQSQANHRRASAPGSTLQASHQRTCH